MKLLPQNLIKYKLLKFLHPIYKLKQSGCNWNFELNNFLSNIGYKRLVYKLYIYQAPYSIMIDYISITFLSLQEIQKILCILKDNYKITV